MKRRRRQSDQDMFIEQVKARQRNVVWPGPLINTRGVDAFLFNGSPNPTLVQRIGAWLFGFTFIALGIGFLVLTLDGAAVFSILAIGSLALGVRICYNGCRKARSSDTRDHQRGN